MRSGRPVSSKRYSPPSKLDARGNKQLSKVPPTSLKTVMTTQRDTALRDPSTLRRHSTRSLLHVITTQFVNLGDFHHQAPSVPDRHPPENFKGIKNVTRKVIKHLPRASRGSIWRRRSRRTGGCMNMVLPLFPPLQPLSLLQNSHCRLYTTPSSFPQTPTFYHQYTGYMPPNPSPPTALLLVIYST